jgi:hypothetical protein
MTEYRVFDYSLTKITDYLITLGTPIIQSIQSTRITPSALVILIIPIPHQVQDTWSLR